MKLFFLFIILLSHHWAHSSETSLLKACGQQDLLSCEKLGAHYLANSEWEKAILVGEALCTRDISRGCMFAGSAYLAQGKLKKANSYLTQSCDKFESLACRSLGRLMKKAGETNLAKMYFKRACFYGLKEICPEVKQTKFSPTALSMMEKISKDCVDTQSVACKVQIDTVQSCMLPLINQDCALLAGQLSIYFRAKFIQAEAKVALLALHAAQKSLKEAPKPNSFSYDLGLVMKGLKSQDKHNYVVGFMKGCTKKYVRSKRAKTNSQQINPAAYKHLSARTMANVLSYFSKGSSEDCYDSKAGYEAYAVGSLDPLNPTHLDVWRIDQDQRVVNLVDGLPLP